MHLFQVLFKKNSNPHHPSEKYKVEVIVLAIEKVIS